MLKTMSIENLQGYKKPIENEIIVVSATIEGEEHYTADVRKIGDSNYAVFSNITKDGITKDGTKKCIEYGIYEPVSIEFISSQSDHYIWVTFKIN